MYVSLWLVHEFLKCKDPLDEGRLVFFRAVCTGECWQNKECCAFFWHFFADHSKKYFYTFVFFLIHSLLPILTTQFPGAGPVHFDLAVRRICSDSAHFWHEISLAWLCQFICWPTHELFIFFADTWFLDNGNLSWAKDDTWNTRLSRSKRPSTTPTFDQFEFFIFFFHFSIWKKRKKREKKIKFQRTARSQQQYDSRRCSLPGFPLDVSDPLVRFFGDHRRRLPKIGWPKKHLAELTLFVVDSIAKNAAILTSLHRADGWWGLERKSLPQNTN